MAPATGSPPGEAGAALLGVVLPAVRRPVAFAAVAVAPLARSPAFAGFVAFAPLRSARPAAFAAVFAVRLSLRCPGRERGRFPSTPPSSAIARGV
jgi:hypothetical protein